MPCDCCSTHEVPSKKRVSAWHTVHVQPRAKPLSDGKVCLQQDISDSPSCTLLNEETGAVSVYCGLVRWGIVVRLPTEVRAHSQGVQTYCGPTQFPKDKAAEVCSSPLTHNPSRRGYLMKRGQLYRYAPNNDVSVNDGPHIRRWSHKIII
jgi:hypothetical protein